MIFHPSAPPRYQAFLRLLHFQLNFSQLIHHLLNVLRVHNSRKDPLGLGKALYKRMTALTVYHCRWIAKIWGEPLITTSGRSLFTYRLALYIQQLDDYILRYCGRQTAQLVGSALHGIPTTLIGPLLQLINVYTALSS